MKMPTAAPLGKPPIPPPPQPAPAEPDRAAIVAALYRLLILATWLTLMRLLGYRLSRNRAKAPARTRTHTPAATAPTPARAANPRRKHRTIDRQLCVAMLAGINTQFAAAQPPAIAQSPTPRRAASRPSHPALPAPHPRAIPLSASQRRRPDPPLSKPAHPITPTHVHFVPLS
jgi:hypothetical protein